MDEPRDQVKESPERGYGQGEPSIGRRRLLKILAAGGGALAASALLPEAWSAPAVEAKGPGAGDDGLRLMGLHVTGNGKAGFAYYDPLAQVDDHTLLQASIDGISHGGSLSRFEGLERHGNALLGMIKFPLWQGANSSTHQLCVQMSIVNGSSVRNSNNPCLEYKDKKK